jgi:hypothetical protein
MDMNPISLSLSWKPTSRWLHSLGLSRWGNKHFDRTTKCVTPCDTAQHFPQALYQPIYPEGDELQVILDRISLMYCACTL